MFNSDAIQLDAVVRIRDSFIGNFTKQVSGQQFLQLAVLTGITDITSVAVSPLGNPVRFPFLQDDLFKDFYGITEDEFEYLIDKHEFRSKKKELEDYYNGYKWGEKSIYNTESLLLAIQFRKTKCYWNKNKLISYFTPLLRFGKAEIMFRKLLNDGVYRCEATTFSCDLSINDLIDISDCCKNPTKPLNFILLEQFLYQLGYLTNGDESQTLKIPNMEVRKQLIDQLYKPYFSAMYTCEALRSFGNNFTTIVTQDFQIEKSCQAFQDLLNANQGSNLNHQAIQSLLYVSTLHVDDFVNRTWAEQSVAEYGSSNRMDMVLCYEKYLVIVEIKYNKTTDDAINQIVVKNYADIIDNEEVVPDKSKMEFIVYFGLNVSANKDVSMKYYLLDKDKNVIQEKEVPSEELER